MNFNPPPSNNEAEEELTYATNTKENKLQDKLCASAQELAAPLEAAWRNEDKFTGHLQTLSILRS